MTSIEALAWVGIILWQVSVELRLRDLRDRR
jgi:hypothetical protein